MNLFDLVKAIFVENEEDIPASFDEFISEDETIAADTLNSINYVNDEICKSFPWSFRDTDDSITTVINQDSYDLPNGKIDYIKITDNNGIASFLDEVEFNTIITDTSKGMPTKYAIRSNKMYLRPIPDSEYKIDRYFLTNIFAKAADGTFKRKLELETDTSIITPENLHSIIVFGACLNISKKPTKDKYAHWTKRYNQLLSEFPDGVRTSTNQCTNIRTVNTDW